VLGRPTDNAESAALKFAARAAFAKLGPGRAPRRAAP
jgi:hypothetical protein